MFVDASTVNMFIDGQFLFLILLHELFVYYLFILIYDGIAVLYVSNTS